MIPEARLQMGIVTWGPMGTHDPLSDLCVPNAEVGNCHFLCRGPEIQRSKVTGSRSPSWYGTERNSIGPPDSKSLFLPCVLVALTDSDPAKNAVTGRLCV